MSDDAGRGDPVSWLLIRPGWKVVAADGAAVGEVDEIAGDDTEDIFDGLAVESGKPSVIRYLPAEQVGMIYPGRVTLKITAAAAANLELFHAPPPETKWTPGKAPLATRVSRWLGGRR